MAGLDEHSDVKHTERQCRQLLQSKTYQQFILLGCANMVVLQGNKPSAFSKFANRFYQFTTKYEDSKREPKRQLASVKNKIENSMQLPSRNAHYVVAELNMYRDAIKSVNISALENCPDTDTTDLKDDLKIPENKTNFLRVTRALFVCSQKLYLSDKGTYSKLFRSLNTYWRGSRRIK